MICQGEIKKTISNRTEEAAKVPDAFMTGGENDYFVFILLA